MCARTSTVLLTRDGNLTRPFGRAVEHGLLDGVHVLEMRVGRDVEHGPARRTVREEMDAKKRRTWHDIHMDGIELTQG